MTAIPSLCPACGHVFQDNSIVIENSSNVTLSNNSTRCPRCGGRAKLLEGNFDVTPNGKINMISGTPPITRSMLEKFDLLTRDAIRYDVELPVYAVRSSEIHPSFGHVVAETAKKNPKKSAVLLAVLTAIASCNWDGNKLLDQTGVAEVVREKVIGYSKLEKPVQKDDPTGATNTSANAATEENP